jgi:IS30 family transposase
LTYEQRETIALMLAAGVKDTVIAAEVGCHKATVGRERRRNGNAEGS